MKIGLISDTHGYLDEKIFRHFEDVDEIWHAGDLGTIVVADQLSKLKPFRAVYGNIDGKGLRIRYPEDLIFELEGLKIWMTHIGGYPPSYEPRVRRQIDIISPQIFISGHSHILKVIPDKKRPGLIHINPGAAGQQGFHRMRTIIKMEIANGKIMDMKVVELGKRGRM